MFFGKIIKFGNYFFFDRSREEELAALNERVQRAVKQRDVEIQRITEAAEQSSLGIGTFAGKLSNKTKTEPNKD